MKDQRGRKARGTLEFQGPLPALLERLAAQQRGLLAGRKGAKQRLARAGREYVRLELVRSLLTLLEADVPDTAPVALELELAPLKRNKSGGKKPGLFRPRVRNRQVSSGRRQWLELSGRMADGTRFRLRMRERIKRVNKAGRPASRRKPEKPPVRKRKQATVVDLVLRFKPQRYPALEAAAVEAALQLPRWITERQVEVGAGLVRLKTKAKVRHSPEELLPWATLSFLSLYQALIGARRVAKGRAAPSAPVTPAGGRAAPGAAVTLAAPAPPAPDPAKARSFQNLVLAALTDGEIDDTEYLFLAQRARQLEIANAEARELIRQVEAGEVRSLHLPSGAAAREESFKDLARIVRADGAIDPRERRLILALGAKLQVSAELVARALS